MSEIIFTNDAPTPIGGSGSILTLAEYKMRRQLPEASPERDEAIEAALQSAEDAVLQYTGRDFTQPAGAETRNYVYDGSGILEVDDFTELTDITVDGESLPNGWTAGPREGATFYWIDLGGRRAESPLMGFTRNLDTLLPSPGRYRVNAAITAQFGWPGEAPASIKQAITWLVDEFYKKEGTQGDVQAEAIANLSYVYQRISEENELPPRVTTLLDQFRRLAL